jgi:putative NADH-flavin reductase
MAGRLLADATRMTEIIQASDLDWVVVRPPFVTDGPRTGRYRAGYLAERGRPTIARADLADFMLRQVTEDTYLRQAPIIAY